MPEGDTVHKAAAALHRALAGRRILRADLRVPALATAGGALAGQTVTEVLARGKHLLLRTDAGMTLHTHLKMEGAWKIVRAGERVADRSDTVRVVLETDGWTAIGTQLGIVELMRTRDEEKAVGHLGPDLLGPDWDSDEALRRLAADAPRPIGDALLDQRVMAGLGNVYRCEICFLRGVHPDTSVGDTRDLPGLIALAKRLLEANRAGGNQVTTGDDRLGRRQWVYGRAGRPCRRCGATIAKMAGDAADRVTYWCPSCQPAQPAMR
jgi:DNA-formamidopyrimidine glycosylase